MAIEKLLGAVPLAAFFEEHFLKQPFSSPGGCRHLGHLGSWAAIERILAQPDVDAIVGRQGERWPGQSPPDFSLARKLVTEGYTLGIRRAHRHDAGLAELAVAFQSDFHAPIDIHLYCTPAGSPGFGWHYDAEDVFVLQMQGGKQWQLRKNTVNPWPLVETLPADMRHDREMMPLVRCTLAAGDWLYIPSGWWHRTEAGDESISLSVGVLSATAIDVYDFLRARLIESLRWRQRLPPTAAAGAPEDEKLQRYRALFRDLAGDLVKEFYRDELIAEFLKHRRQKTQEKQPNDANNLDE